MARGTRGSGMRNRGNRTPYVNPNPSNNQRGEWARRNRNQGDTVVVETPQKVLSEDPATSNTTPKTTKDQTVPDHLDIQVNSYMKIRTASNFKSSNMKEVLNK